MNLTTGRRNRHLIIFILTLALFMFGNREGICGGISVSPSSPVVGQSVNFSYTSETGQLVWDFGDGYQQSRSGNSISHTFYEASSYTIKVWDQFGDWGGPPNGSVTIQVREGGGSSKPGVKRPRPARRPLRKIVKKGTVQVSPQMPREGEKVFLSVKGFQSKCVTYDYGDGKREKSSSVSRKVSHQYKKPGSYTVKVYADCGRKVSASKKIKVLKVNRGLSASKSRVSVGEQVRFQTKEFLSDCVTWDVGNRRKVKGKVSMQHRYNKPGNYIVKAWDYCGKGVAQPVQVKVRVLDNGLKITDIQLKINNSVQPAKVKLKEPLASMAELFYKGKGNLTYQWLLDSKPIGAIKTLRLGNGGRIKLTGPPTTHLTSRLGSHRLSLKFFNLDRSIRIPSASFLVAEAAINQSTLKDSIKEKKLDLGKAQEPDFGEFKLHFFQAVKPVVIYDQKSPKNPVVDIYLSAEGATEIALKVPVSKIKTTDQWVGKMEGYLEIKKIPAAGSINEIIRLPQTGSSAKQYYILRKEGNNHYIPVELEIVHKRPGYETVTIKRSVKQYVAKGNKKFTSEPVINKFGLAVYKRPLPANYKDMSEYKQFPPKGTIWITKAQRILMERRVNLDFEVKGADVTKIIHLKSGKVVDIYKTAHTDIISLPPGTPNRPELLDAGVYQLQAQNVHGTTTATYELIQQDGNFAAYMKTRFNEGCWKEVTDESGKKIMLPRYTGKGHYKPSPRYGEPGYGQPVEKYECKSRIHNEEHIKKFYGYQKPTINLFQVEGSNQIGPDESAKLIMSVSDALYGRIQNDITIELFETDSKKKLTTHVFKRGESHSMEKGYYFKSGKQSSYYEYFVRPTQPTSYTLVARNKYGKTTGKTVVKIHRYSQKPVINHFYISPKTQAINMGEMVRVHYRFSNADKAELYNLSTGKKITEFRPEKRSGNGKGAMSFKLQAITEYELRVTNIKGDMVSRRAEMVVRLPNQAGKPPQPKFFAVKEAGTQRQSIDPNKPQRVKADVFFKDISIEAGDKVSLHYQFSGADKAVIINKTTGSQLANLSFSSNPPYQGKGKHRVTHSPRTTTTYQLKLSNKFGETIVETTVKVNTGLLKIGKKATTNDKNIPQIIIFTADKQLLQQGEPCRLTYKLKNVDKADIWVPGTSETYPLKIDSNGQAKGMVTLYPGKQNMAYELRAQKKAIQVSKALVIVMTPKATVEKPVIVQFEPDKVSVNQGDRVKFSYEVRNSDSAFVEGIGTTEKYQIKIGNNGAAKRTITVYPRQQNTAYMLSVRKNSMVVTKSKVIVMTPAGKSGGKGLPQLPGVGKQGQMAGVSPAGVELSPPQSKSRKALAQTKMNQTGKKQGIAGGAGISSGVAIKGTLPKMRQPGEKDSLAGGAGLRPGVALKGKQSAKSPSNKELEALKEKLKELLKHDSMSKTKRGMGIESASKLERDLAEQLRKLLESSGESMSKARDRMSLKSATKSSLPKMRQPGDKDGFAGGSGISPGVALKGSPPKMRQPGDKDSLAGGVGLKSGVALKGKQPASSSGKSPSNKELEALKEKLKELLKQDSMSKTKSGMGIESASKKEKDLAEQLRKLLESSGESMSKARNRMSLKSANKSSQPKMGQGGKDSLAGAGLKSGVALKGKQSVSSSGQNSSQGASKKVTGTPVPGSQASVSDKELNVLAKPISSSNIGLGSVVLKKKVSVGPGGVWKGGMLPDDGGILTGAKVLGKIHHFYFTPKVINAGEKTTLYFKYSGADSKELVEIKMRNSNNLFYPPFKTSNTGTFPITPQKTSKYLFTFTDENKNFLVRSAEIIVQKPAGFWNGKKPTIHKFSASPTSIKAGELVTFQYEFEGATYVNLIRNGKRFALDIPDSKVGEKVKDDWFFFPTETTNLQLEAGNRNGSVFSQVINIGIKNVQKPAIFWNGKKPKILNACKSQLYPSQKNKGPKRYIFMCDVEGATNIDLILSTDSRSQKNVNVRNVAPSDPKAVEKVHVQQYFYPEEPKTIQLKAWNPNGTVFSRKFWMGLDGKYAPKTNDSGAGRREGHGCSKNYQCASGYCADGTRCASDKDGIKGAYCHHGNHCKSRRCKCPEGVTGGFCKNYKGISDAYLGVSRRGGYFTCQAK